METGNASFSGNNEALLSLESALLTACETLSGLANLAVNFQYDSQELLFSKVNELVRDLDKINERASATTQTVPLDVLDAIDRGRNPEHTTLQVLESCCESNNVARGKQQVMKLFRDELDKQMVEAGVVVDDKSLVLAEVKMAVEKANQGGSVGVGSSTNNI